MNPEYIPFPTGWMSFDLGDYRPCDGTYCFYPYEELPPLDESLFRGEFQWLPCLEDVSEEAILRAAAYCAPSFEAFLYRFWLENTIWFSLNDRKPSLTDEQKRYVSHYETN